MKGATETKKTRACTGHMLREASGTSPGGVLRISSLYYGYRVGKEAREATEGTLGKVKLELKNYG